MAFELCLKEGRSMQIQSRRNQCGVQLAPSLLPCAYMGLCGTVPNWRSKLPESLRLLEMVQGLAQGLGLEPAQELAQELVHPHMLRLLHTNMNQNHRLRTLPDWLQCCTEQQIGRAHV